MSPFELVAWPGSSLVIRTAATYLLEMGFVEEAELKLALFYLCSLVFSSAWRGKTTICLHTRKSAVESSLLPALVPLVVVLVVLNVVFLTIVTNGFPSEVLKAFCRMSLRETWASRETFINYCVVKVL